MSKDMLAFFLCLPISFHQRFSWAFVLVQVRNAPELSPGRRCFAFWPGLACKPHRKLVSCLEKAYDSAEVPD